MKTFFQKIFFIFSCSLFFPLAVQATPVDHITTGSYIKLENNPAIYYINKNKERQYFAYGWIFKCYQKDYTQVQILPENTDLESTFRSAMQGAMPPLPGCGLVKSPASPSVYAFDAQGARHKIKDEVTAKALYGENWSTQIYDMPDFLLSLFPLGTPFDTTSDLKDQNDQEKPSTTSDTTQWKPTPGTTWQWQLDMVPKDNFLSVNVYDIDLFEATADDVKRLHDAGKKVICYINVGAFEDWRDDANSFPEAILGENYGGWEGERWLDIRATSTLYPILEKRFDACKTKGFDAIEPDNIDGYQNDTGFPITPSQQMAFNMWLSQQAHERGLSIGLKNNPDQAQSLFPYFDFALTEDCAQDDWCEDVSIFSKHNKAVFQAEYTDTEIQFDKTCEESQDRHYSMILKHRDLDEYIKICN